MSLRETLECWSGGPMVGKCLLWVASEVLSLCGCYGECNVNWSRVCFLVYWNWVYCCRGGICIWAASYPGNAASPRSGAASFLGSLSRNSGNRYILVDFLRSPYHEHVSALTWSPDGRYPY